MNTKIILWKSSKLLERFCNTGDKSENSKVLIKGTFLHNKVVPCIKPKQIYIFRHLFLLLA